MKRICSIICLLLAFILLLSGCEMTTTKDMYQLPKRSDSFNDLQKAIDTAMVGMDYCAPLAGENRQTVHMADLDGDKEKEYLLFAKSNQDKPLRILVFRNVDGTYVNTDTVACNGTAFDQVEYVDMDGRGGVEMVVGCQLSDQVIRSASVYSFEASALKQQATVNYTKLITTDLDTDGFTELLFLRPGATEGDNGVVALYHMKDGAVQRYNEASMSQPADKLKRIIQGKLDGGKSAVYMASAVGDTALVTDVFTVLDGVLTNVTLSNESGTDIRTMRNYYVYADDIDGDGVVELPSIIPMQLTERQFHTDTHHLIRWYAMTPTGEEVDKMYTYHNFSDGWYMQLSSDLASRITVTDIDHATVFYLWDKQFLTTEKLLTVHSFTGASREEQGLSDGRFILHKTDTTVYAASLEQKAATYDFSTENVVYNFRLIQRDWKTGET